MSSVNVNGFWKWFDEERGEIAVLEVEKLSRSPRGRISNSYRKKMPTLSACKAIAKGLGIPEEEVLRRAGLLSSLPLDDPNPTIDELIKVARRLKPLDQVELLNYAKYRWRGQVVAERDIEVRIQILEILEKMTSGEREKLVISILEQNDFLDVVKKRFGIEIGPDQEASLVFRKSAKETPL